MRPASLLRAACIVGLLTGTSRADLILNEIVDGTLPGGQPKWVELKNTGTTTVDVTLYEIANYNNGNTLCCNGNPASPLTGSALAAGSYYVVAYENASTNSTYSSVYNDTPDLYTGPFVNGNDAIALRDINTNAVLDVYGVIGVDGIGQTWEYTDSYAFACGRSAASATFDPGEWIAAGPNALEDTTGCGDPCEVQNLQNYTTPRAETTTMAPGPNNYCTSGTSSSGCNAIISAVGSPSATAGSGLLVSVVGVEGNKDGLFFYGQNGTQANPWGNGTSYQCVVPPVKRGGLLTATGNAGACDGCFVQDLNARWCSTCPKPTHAPMIGTPIQIQFWYRDPLNTSNQTTSLSDAIEVP